MSKRKKPGSKKTGSKKAEVIPEVSVQAGFSNLFKKRKTPKSSVALIDLTNDDDGPASISEIPPVKNAPTAACVDPINPADVVSSITDNDEKTSEQLLKTNTDNQRNEAGDKQLAKEEEENESIDLGALFHDIYNAVQNDPEKWCLLHCTVQSVLIEMNEDLNNDQIDELLRWYTRRSGWRKQLRKSKPDNFQKLLSTNMLASIDENTDLPFDELLQILSNDELQTVARTMMIDKKHRRNMETLKAKLTLDYKTFTKSNFGAMSPSERLKRCVRKTLEGKRFRLEKRVHRGINMLFLSYSPTICDLNNAGHDGQVPGSASMRINPVVSIGQSFINNIRQFGQISEPTILNIRFPLTPTRLIFSSNDLKKLHEALTYKYQLDELIDSKKFEKARSIADSAAKVFKTYKKTFPQFYEDQKELPGYLFRYTTTGTFVKIIRLHVDILERLKEYYDAIELLKMLLKMKVCTHRRGYWWIRLIINYG